MNSKLPGITYEDRGGETPETSVIIHGTMDNAAGIRAEYEFLTRRLGIRNKDWRFVRQSTREAGGRRWDMVVVEPADGAEKTVYFDITEFFGKW